MKKLTLTVAVLLSATYVFAQDHISVINQVNDFNQAVVTQTGGDHNSNVLQTSNAATILQLNKVKVTQKDNGLADGNVSVVKQGGHNQISTVVQEGTNNMNVYIGGRLNGSNPVSDVAANAGNETYAKQVGTGNKGEQSIYGSNATGTYLELKQKGTNNQSQQNGQYSVASTGLVDQGNILTSSGNMATQFIDGANELVSILQNGNSNQAWQWTNGGSSNNNTSSIVQTGNSNIARIMTKGPGYSGDYNFSSITQTGDGNKFKGLGTPVDMWHPEPEAVQNGNNNSVVTLQMGNTNTFSIAQTGNNNKIEGAILLAGLGASQMGNSNVATIAQDGDDNLSQSRQKGNSNTIDLSQVGDNLTSVISQYKGLFSSANSNVATVIQAGTGHSSTTIQNGNSNVVTVNQSGI